MPTLLFSLIYLCLMLVPGWLLAAVLRIEHNRLLFAIALSVAIMTVNLVVVRLIGIHYSAAAALTAVQTVVLLLIFLRTDSRASLYRWLDTDSYAAGGLLLVALAAGGYAGFAGPYLEVPADGWWHLAKINDLLDVMGRSPRGSSPWDDLWHTPNLYGYFLPSLAAWLSGLGVVDVLESLNVLNTILFCGAVYTFALYIFEGPGLGSRPRVWCAVITVLLFVAQFGVNVFSFVRYYVYAPGFMNYLLYLATAALVVEFYRRGSWRVGLPVLGFLSLAAYLVHKQEFLFVVLMASFLVAVEFFKSRHHHSACNRGTAAALLSVVLAGWAVLWVVSYTRFSRANPLAYDTILPLERLLPFFKNLYVADPTFQFYEVIGVWGVVVYLLFFLALLRKENMSGFLVAGMLTPFLTIFNPFFVDLFLRHNYPDVIWRICYMIPLPFAGAWFFTRAIHRLVFEPSRPMRRRITDAAVTVALVVFLFPITTTFFESKYSRLYTVVPAGPGVDFGQWQDMFMFLRGIEKETVITDQVTGYLVNALTPHYYRGHKFYGFGAPKIRRKNYNERTFSRYTGALVIVNQRDGGLSRTGKLSGHWPENILKLSSFYPRDFLTHIENNPHKYKKIWDQQDIQVYEIQS